MISTSSSSASVVLLDDGNLVLRNGSSSSPPIWQTFDHPTHTFLRGSKLRYNKRTNTKQCSVWEGDLLNLSEDNTNGETIYVKVASKDLQHRKKRKGFTVNTVVGRKRSLVRKTAMEGLLVAFAYRDLQIATKNFADKLGGGGFGSVFKGVLRDSSVVAVKKLESMSQGEKQFMSEVSTIGSLQHVHLVHLRGFCVEGVAVTAKVDVFSYGMLLFELVNGKRNTDGSDDSRSTFFPCLAASILMAGGDILSLLDSRLNREASIEEVIRICKVAFWCIQDEEESRPSMSVVEQILEGVVDVNMPPVPQSVQFSVDNLEPIVFFTESSSQASS
ncbi:hypothetical protein L6452_17441 [Arctium lappa]|uniref:Uncharacterized protein n=1 Tax=Arctium lappa TaxID=4217 RepID=A0ACB9C3G2_ARCLA|nr:hypothetical protein L6452_17441 [Arctium lappa]